MIDFQGNIKRFIEIVKIGWQLFDGYRKHIVTLTVLGFLGSLAGAVGVNALIPLFSFFDGQDNLVGTDFISESLHKIFLFFNISFTLITVLVLICFLFILKSAILYIFDYIKIHIQTKYQKDVMSRTLNESLGADWSYLMKQKIGYLENVIRTDVAISTQMLDVMSNLFMGISSFFVYMIVAINISQAVTLMTMVAGLIIFFIFKPLLYKARQYSSQNEVLNKEVSRHINENISGIKTVKANGVEVEVGDIGSFLFERLRFVRIKTYLLRRIAVLFIEPLAVIFIAGVVAFSFYQTSYNLGALTAIIYLIKQIFSYIQNIQSSIHTLNESIPYAKSVIRYQEQAEKFQEKKMEKGTENFVFENNLKFENVVFEYESGKKALKGVDFEIKKGEMVGFIGPSGGGKSTIFDLLLRFFDSIEGKVYLDKEDVKNISIKDWRKNIAYVPQDIFLLNDTIKENIRFRNKDITDEEVISAAKDAHIYDFIQELPDGLDTMVGERGMMLSGGQRQRIVIARALARKPQILLLDEATSALDKESEKIIQKVLEEKKGEITILTIAHRLSTVRNADKLIVVEDGKVIESGNPKELLAEKSTYFSKICKMED